MNFSKRFVGAINSSEVMRRLNVALCLQAFSEQVGLALDDAAELSEGAYSVDAIQRAGEKLIFLRMTFDDIVAYSRQESVPMDIWAEKDLSLLLSKTEEALQRGFESVNNVSRRYQALRGEIFNLPGESDFLSERERG